MMRKSKIWIIVGIILLFGAFGLTIHNYYEDYQAKEVSTKEISSLQVIITEVISVD